MRRFLFLLSLITLSAFAVASQAEAGGGHVSTLKVINQKVGTGAKATKGDTVTVNYTGWLYKASAKNKHGKEFDSSFNHGQPFSFTLGQGRVIPGWDKGIVGMRVGGKRTLIIPPAMAYGARGAGNLIPPNATLVFNVALLKVSKH